MGLPLNWSVLLATPPNEEEIAGLMAICKMTSDECYSILRRLLFHRDFLIAQIERLERDAEAREV